VPRFDEEAVLRRLDRRRGRGFPAALRAALAELVGGKWRSLEHRQDEAVLCFDTVVHDGIRVWGKPADRAEAARFIRALAGREHAVTTGGLIGMGSWWRVRQWTTRVRFRKLRDADIARVLDSEPALDAAGAYKIQGFGLSYVESLRGDYHNVVGLPLPFLDWLRKGCP